VLKADLIDPAGQYDEEETGPQARRMSAAWNSWTLCGFPHGTRTIAAINPKSGSAVTDGPWPESDITAALHIADPPFNPDAGATDKAGWCRYGTGAMRSGLQLLRFVNVGTAWNRSHGSGDCRQQAGRSIIPSNSWGPSSLGTFVPPEICRSPSESSLSHRQGRRPFPMRRPGSHHPSSGMISQCG
jgi:hypothetical protein